MAKNAIMVDLETLATTPNATILSIGAVKFDPYKDELNDEDMESFYVKIDLDSCADLNFDVSDDTIEWWAKQSAEAQFEAFDAPGRLAIADAMGEFYKFAWGCSTVWANGAAFDVPVLENAFNKIGRAAPWKYWQVRDVRTMFDLGITPFRPPITSHHALEDAWNQAVGVQSVTRELVARGLNPFVTEKR